jgi:hypothetical protein
LFFAPFALPALLLLPGSFGQASFASGSFTERQTGWVANLDQAAEPFGNGIGTTGSAAEKAIAVRASGDDFYQPDNNYYKVMYELGVLGLFFFAATLIACFLYTRDVEKQVQGTERAITIGTSANILAAAVAAITLVYFEVFPNELFFWLLMGTVTSCVRNVPESSSTPSR